MRWIINFIVIGFLIYVIYRLYPEAITVMAGWAGVVYDYIAEGYHKLIEQFQHEKTAEHTKTAALLLGHLIR